MLSSRRHFHSVGFGVDFGRRADIFPKKSAAKPETQYLKYNFMPCPALFL